MKKRMNSFWKSESGAVTTEFIVICAAVVVMGVAGASGLGDNPTSQEDVDVDINTTLQRFSSGN